MNAIDWRAQPDGSEHGHLGDAFLFRLEWCDERECWSLDFISGEMDYGFRRILYDYDDLGADELRRSADALLRGDGAIDWNDRRSAHSKWTHRRVSYRDGEKASDGDGPPTIHRIGSRT